MSFSSILNRLGPIQKHFSWQYLILHIVLYLSCEPGSASFLGGINIPANAQQIRNPDERHPNSE